MTSEPDIAVVANLLGDTARSKMMMALMGGKALTATELAVVAEITPQTASSHLGKLVERDLLTVIKQGRHRYFRLFNYEVAELVESLLNVSANAKYLALKVGPKNSELRKARICYDHLAGELGVALLDALTSSGILVTPHNDLVLSDYGSEFFNARGANIEHLKSQRRPLCKQCLDWSERRFHLAGLLGKWIIDDIIARKWAEKDFDTRIIRFSDIGLKSFKRMYKLRNC